MNLDLATLQAPSRHSHGAGPGVLNRPVTVPAAETLKLPDGSIFREVGHPLPVPVPTYITKLADGVSIVMEPGRIRTQVQARALGPYHFFFDGAVAAKTYIDLERKQACFDHHVFCDRARTPSAAWQWYWAVKRGFMQKMRGEEGRAMQFMHFNHYDADVGFCAWVSKNQERIVSGRPPLPTNFLKLLHRQDTLDRVGGCVACDPNDPDTRLLAFMIEPYELARMGKVRLDAKGMAGVVEQVCDRIDLGLADASLGNGKELDMRYHVVGGSPIDVEYKGPKWIMVEEEGYYARIAIANRKGEENVDGMISARQIGENTWAYTAMKTRPHSSFEVRALCEIFNAVDGLPPWAPHRWGGNLDYIVGAPYNIGSQQPPRVINQLVNDYGEFARSGGAKSDPHIDFIQERFPAYHQQVLCRGVHPRLEM